ncbi:VMAP-C domain-containing protein [Streptomyces hiroshimensis]|uniref:Serine protease n=1 Tax=Streptomyces hiroshimensis TaxID=66424 RepID=A0ABQ2YTZ4_9ACTN|nr:trypsin-like peptidase domain-containing protein [Streptomyces hiroshimensis]GGX93567.1 hypothetical protein GCM10010324_44440 [Streptomyces hiroshimensis]
MWPNLGQVRALSPDGSLWGAGILVAPRTPNGAALHVLTCAHVVISATGGPPAGGLGELGELGELTVDFPGRNWSAAARPVPGGWAPPPPLGHVPPGTALAGSADLAVLALDPGHPLLPRDCGPLPLAPCGSPDGRRVSVIGYPRGAPAGLIATAVLTGGGGPCPDWLQLDALHTTGAVMEHGFSGAAVWDPDRGRVIGLVTAAHTDRTVKAAWMLPVEAAVRLWPPLAGAVGDQAVSDRPPDDRSVGPRRCTPPPPEYGGPEADVRQEPPRYLVDAVMEVGCITDDGTLYDLVLRYGRTARAALVGGTAGTARRSLVVRLVQDLCGGPAGLAPLVKSLEWREGDSVAIRKLRVATALWEVELLGEEEWDELFLLLDGVRIPDLHRRYSGFLHARRLPAAPGHCSEPWTVFLHAATLNARPGEALPCFQVLEQLLALGAEDAVRLRIVEWARRYDPHPPDQRTAPRPAADPPEPLPSRIPDVPDAPGIPGTPGTPDVWDPPDYLIIRIRPLLAPEQGRNALLSHWWRLHPEGQLRGTDRRIDLDHAESEVRSLIRQAESEWAYLKSDLAIEFVLPQGLLGMTVERWRKAPFQGVDGVLGEDHHVVLRSLERIDRRDLHGSWSRRWRDFTNGCAGRVHWFPQDGRRHLLSDPPPAVAVLSAPPDGARSEEGVHDQLNELAAALRAGVPVVLWDRRNGIDPAFRTALRSLLDSRDPRGLPGLVKSLRISSGDRDPEEYFVVGRHVALLWDDPNRMPVAPGTHPVPPPADREEGP